MFTAFERAVAFRYLRARKGERFVSIIAVFSLLGIALGVATLIIVMSVMNGFRAELRERVIGLNAHVTVTPERGARLEGADAIAARLAALPGVVQAVPVIEGQVLLTSGTGATAAGQVRGIAPDALRARPALAPALAGVSFEPGTVVMGARLAQRLQLRVGDSVTLVLPRARAGQFAEAPRTQAFRLAAVFEIGMQEVDGRHLFITPDAAASLFGLEGAASGVEIMVADPSRMEETAAAIRRALAGQPVRVAPWQEANSAIFAAMQVERTVMFLILTLIILVAAFNIVSSLTMLVKDKGRDIAVLRTMGAARGAVLRIFLLCGASVGVGGAIIGFVLGLGIATNFPALRAVLLRLEGTILFNPELLFLTRLPSVVDPVEVAQVLAMALVLAVGATLYPAWRAASIDPAEAMRNG